MDVTYRLSARVLAREIERLADECEARGAIEYVSLHYPARATAFREVAAKLRRALLSAVIDRTDKAA